MIIIMFDDIPSLLESRRARRREIDEGGYLFHQGDPVASVFAVRSGSVELTRHQRDGGIIVLQRARGGSVLAEASIYSNVYHCNAIAAAASVVLEIPRDVFLKLLDDRGFAGRWAAHLARETQAARYRSEILVRRTVAERLDGWLDWPGNELPPRGRLRELAAQLGVSPEALYRELARRRKGKKV